MFYDEQWKEKQQRGFTWWLNFVLTPDDFTLKTDVSQGERQKILNWLLCYNPLWLRIGLETIFGELIALESNSDVMGLAVFILNRLLWNPDIAAEYRHPTVPHFYRDGHEEALSKFTLKKLLLLVCFLDRAKVSRIIEHDPCLFFKNAEFKSSKEILLAFSRDFLSGEGDLSRHLGFLGFPVNHVQTPLDEFEFAVTNLATDLQCGIRLVRTLELLSSDWTPSKKLRVPAISRLQKMHNVKLAFEILNDHGIQLKDEHGSTIDTKDIVDRHREKTFALLWKIVFAFQVNISLDMDQLKAEIVFLKNMQVTKLKRPGVECVNSMGNDTSRSYSYESYGENVKLLMDWVNVVCGFYNIKVENFTVSFSDGRVLCYLIHHYHPCYVPLEAICKHTTQTIECTRSGTLGMNSSSESDASLNLINGTFDQTISTSVLYKELLDNEKRNFQLINAAVSDLGGVPAMIQHSDMSNTIPDEKATWRGIMVRKEIERQHQAAVTIQSYYRMHVNQAKFKHFTEAAITIQRWYRAVTQARNTRQKYLALKEVTVKMQAIYRGLRERRKIQCLNQAAICIQAMFKMHRCNFQYRTLKRSATIIQARYRAFCRGQKDREKYLALRKSSLILQAAYRGMKIRQELRSRHQSILVIQSYYRMYRERKAYLKLVVATKVIQQWYRASRDTNAQIYKYKMMKISALQIQAAFRGTVERIFLEEED
ncbi:Abnormal spindle-like microcephaly-associated protein-like protein, partial [Ophiophagus hannah]